jgi:hypothetical protein
VAELALDDVERHALACELDGVRVAQLVRCEAAPDPRLRGEPAELDADVGARPEPAARRAVNDAEQRPDREARALPGCAARSATARRSARGFLKPWRSSVRFAGRLFGATCSNSNRVVR